MIRPAVECAGKPPLTGFGDMNGIGLVPGHRAPDLVAQRTGVVGVLEWHMVDGPAVLAQFRREVAHGTEDQGDLLRVVGDVSGLVGDFSQQHDGIVGLAGAQRGNARVELVAEDERERSHATRFGVGRGTDSGIGICPLRRTPSTHCQGDSGDRSRNSSAISIVGGYPERGRSGDGSPLAGPTPETVAGV